MSALLLFAASGCAVVTAPVGALSGPTGFLQEQAAYNDTTDSLVLGWRNGVWAKKAWYQHEHLYSQHPHLRDLGKGFRAAYTDVANGGGGCPPVLPPREYWSWRYQSPEGQAKAAAWFEGYPLGAAAAEKDGIANWGEVQTSHTANSKSIRAREAYKRYYSQHRPTAAENVPVDQPEIYPENSQPEVLPSPVQPPLVPPVNPVPVDPAPAKPDAPALNPPKLDGNGSAQLPNAEPVVPAASQDTSTLPAVERANYSVPVEPRIEQLPVPPVAKVAKSPVVRPAPQVASRVEAPVAKPNIQPLPSVATTAKVVEALPQIDNLTVQVEVFSENTDDPPPEPVAGTTAETTAGAIDLETSCRRAATVSSEPEAALTPSQLPDATGIGKSKPIHALPPVQHAAVVSKRNASTIQFRSVVEQESDAVQKVREDSPEAAKGSQQPAEMKQQEMVPAAQPMNHPWPVRRMIEEEEELEAPLPKLSASAGLMAN